MNENCDEPQRPEAPSVPQQLSDIVIGAMQRIAEGIATTAEKEADNFTDIPGDVALRMFARAIRDTHKKAEVH